VFWSVLSSAKCFICEKIQSENRQNPPCVPTHSPSSWNSMKQRIVGYHSFFFCILPKNVQSLRHWLTDEMGNLKGFSNWHSTQSLIFGHDPNLSSWKHCWTTVNNSLHKSSTISQAKNSVKQHHIQNYFYAHILTTCTKQHNIQNYFYADILTTCTTPKFSLAFVNTAP